MIPTLFGVTIVSFVIMQIAPGDPLSTQGQGGVQGAKGESRDAYLVRKRDLKLDRPLIVNLRWFYDYKPDLAQGARIRAMTSEEIAERLNEMAKSPGDEKLQAERRFFQYITDRNLSLTQWVKNKLNLNGAAGNTDFNTRLADPKKHASLAAAIRDYSQIWFEDVGQYGVQSGMQLLEANDTTLANQRGMIQGLNYMVVEPLKFTYSRDASDAETPDVVEVWKAWWERNQSKYPPLDPDRKSELQAKLKEFVAAPSRTELFKLVEDFEYTWDTPDGRFFAETLLGDSTLQEKVISAMILKLFVANPLPLDVAKDASEEDVQRATDNWKIVYDMHKSLYEPGMGTKLYSVLGDTQYAHMVWRLMTFQFGRSTIRTRDPVSTKIWEAVKVSAPLMLMSSLLIYVVAIPLGLVCGVFRGRWSDRLISLGLFLLYSVPPFVAGMLFLLYLSYGEYLKIFPMERLHSDNAQNFGFVRWLLDYFWHAALPVVCLSLFSLAPLAMYARTSLLEVLGQDYIRTARAKGLPESRVILVHALRNSLIPLITLFASFLPAMLGGSVLIEYLFNIPGMGRLSWESILLKDFPVVMALIYIDAIVVMLSILMTDLLYMFVDPRISFEGQRAG